MLGFFFPFPSLVFFLFSSSVVFLLQLAIFCFPCFFFSFFVVLCRFQARKQPASRVLWRKSRKKVIFLFRFISLVCYMVDTGYTLQRISTPLPSAQSLSDNVSAPGIAFHAVFWKTHNLTCRVDWFILFSDSSLPQLELTSHAVGFQCAARHRNSFLPNKPAYLPWKVARSQAQKKTIAVRTGNAKAALRFVFRFPCV